MHEAFYEIYNGIVCVSANGEYQNLPQGEGPGDKAILTYDHGSDESSPFLTCKNCKSIYQTTMCYLVFDYFSHTKYNWEDS